MAPQERTTPCAPEDDSRPNSTIDHNLSNIALGEGFVNKAFVNENDSSDIPPKQHTGGKEEKNNSQKKNTDFDDLLPYVGEFGLYQKILFLLMIPFAFFVAFVYFSQIFMTLVPEQHWCWVPELANLTVEAR
ncbi:unnamed protein product [Plutella xylostella]|uniref:(diamondback moth) hypothetical protein n=1 Tax=Plutella xylostella TaxID=51655 RepID=A0A8S4G4A4_PLUXY|nr:unnamed protein product [Plutella xylostella]